jgi:hypothetical protein
MLQRVQERIAAVTADTDPGIGLGHRRGDLLLGLLDYRHGAADQFRPETARPRSPGPSTTLSTRQGLPRASGRRTPLAGNPASPPSQHGRPSTSKSRGGARSLHLVLQRHFQRRLREAAFVVAAAGLSLALAPPAGPMQAKAVVRAITEQQGEQAPHLRCGQGNQATVRFPLLAAAARVTSRKA